MDKITILNRIRNRICKGWTQGSLARNDKREEVTVFAPEATMFCLVGAIRVECLKEEEEDNEFDIEDELQISLPGSWGRENLEKWNDFTLTTEEDVLSLIDRTIERLRAEA